MIKWFYLILLIFIILKMISTQYEYLTFKSTQLENKTFADSRNQIYKSSINNIPLQKIAEDIDKKYHSQNDIFKNCSQEDREYLFDKKKHYNSVRYDAHKESLLTFMQLVIQFTNNKREQKYLLGLINNYLNPVVFYLKNKYNRVRPEYCFKNLRGDHSIKNVGLPNHASYPSSHAATGYFLYEMTKNNKNFADSLALNREIAGLHYRQDTEFGRFIGTELAKYIKSNPVVKK